MLGQECPMGETCSIGPSQKEIADVITVFNLFDSGFKATLDNSDIKRFGGGHIHTTYCLTNRATGKKYIVQQLNTIFDIAAIDHNLQLFEQAQAQAQSKGFLPPHWKTISYLNVRESSNKVYYDEKAMAWRIMNFVPGEIQIFNSFSEVSLEDRQDTAISLGEAIANFRRMLGSVEIQSWKEPLPNFHNLEYHLEYLDAVLRYEEVILNLSQDASRKAKKQDRIIREYPGGAKRIDNLLRKIQERRSSVAELDELESVVRHNDLFINNAVFIRNKGTQKLECVSFIDLDTIQRGNELGDLGHALYSAGNPAGEEPEDIDDVTIDKEVVVNIIKGYLGKIAEFYGAEKVKMLRKYVFKTFQIAVYEECIRYFADALVGNEYYRLEPGTPKDLNLYRAEVLMRVLEELDKVLPELESALSINEESSVSYVTNNSR